MQPAGSVRWTGADLELLPDNGNRYEIVDGELFVARAPHWKHQRVCSRLNTALEVWSEVSGLGESTAAPGILFTDADNVIPDVVWISHDRLTILLDEGGHLTGAPELVIEVLSPGAENQRRDREAKLRLYSVRGVQEYWIADWQLKQVEVYRRVDAKLEITAVLLANDTLTSPLLPDFACPVAGLFA